MFFSPPVKLVPPVFRPPSEANSLLIQVTIGCSNNKCTYCDMYRSKSYQVRDKKDIFKDLQAAYHFYKKHAQVPRRIFLCDGDALGAPTNLLKEVLQEINRLFPQLDRVGIYATAENMLSKTKEELEELSKLKLNMAYLGMESGSDKVLHQIVKGNTAQDMIEGTRRIKQSGFKLSTIVMLGVGGKQLSKEHIEETAKVLSEEPPHYLSFLTTFSVPGTPYHKMEERGLISPLTAKELFIEMKGILENLELKKHQDSARVIFRANHVSNQFPLGGVLPRDKEKLTTTLDEWIESTPEGVYPPRPLTM